MESSSSDSSRHEPAQLPVGRKISICLDTVQPSAKEDVLRKQEVHKQTHGCRSQGAGMGSQDPSLGRGHPGAHCPLPSQLEAVPGRVAQSQPCPHPCTRQSRDQAGDGPFQQGQLGQEMQGAGLQPLAEAPGAVTGAGQDGEQSCWLFQSLHSSGPVNQMGRCSKLITVGLNGFLGGIMPMPSSLASSHSHFQGL